MFSDENSETFYRRNRHQSGQKSHSTLANVEWLCFLRFIEYRTYSTTQFPTPSICHQHIVKISDKSHRWTICGVGRPTSKSRPNSYNFTIDMEINQQYLRRHLPWDRSNLFDLIIYWLIEEKANANWQIMITNECVSTKMSVHCTRWDNPKI